MRTRTGYNSRHSAVCETTETHATIGPVRTKKRARYSRRDRGGTSHSSHRHARTPHQNGSIPAPAKSFRRAGIH
eukprot:4832473-Prymnesium_polylepis.1